MRKTGETIDAARAISTGQDRKTGHAILRFRAEDGRVVALRLRRQNAAECLANDAELRPEPGARNRAHSRRSPQQLRNNLLEVPSARACHRDKAQR